MPGINGIPRSFEIGDHWEFNRESARWAFDYVDFHTQVVYSKAIEDVRAAQAVWEKPAVERTPMIDAFALDLYKKNPAAARKFLTDYCLGNAERVIDAWWKLGDDLLVKYNHIWIYDAKTRKRQPDELPRLVAQAPRRVQPAQAAGGGEEVGGPMESGNRRGRFMDDIPG